MASLAQINVKFSADLKEFSTQMQKANRQMQKSGEQMKKTGKNLSIGLTAPIVALGFQSFKTFSELEQSLAKVQAVSGATASQFKALSENSELLGRTTRFTAAQVAELQLNYSKLGFKPDEIVAATEATLNLALATGEDLANSATVAAGTLRGFGLDVSEIGRVTDVMAKSFSASALDLEKFQTAMAVVAPVAKNAGVSLELATSQLAVLVDAGVDASTAGTGLRNVFLDLAKSGMTFEEAMEEISTSTNKNATALDLFGKRGATVGAVLADNQKKAKALTIEFENAGGSAKAMAKIMDDTSNGAMLRLQSALEGMFIKIGKQLAPVINELAEYIGDLANEFSELSPATQKIVVIVASLAAALGPLLVTIGYLATNVIPGLIKSFALLRTAMMALTAFAAANPFGAIAIAVGLVVSAILLFSGAADEVIEKQTLLASVTKEAAASVAEEAAQVKRLLFIARDEKVSKDQRLKAIAELNRISPEYLGNLALETINTNAARKAVDLYNESLIKTAKVKAAQSKLQEIQAQIIENEIAASEKRQKALNEDNRRGGDARKDALFGEKGQLESIDNVLVAINGKLKEKEQLLLDLINKNEKVVTTFVNVQEEVTEIDNVLRRLPKIATIKIDMPNVKPLANFNLIPPDAVDDFDDKLARMRLNALEFNEAIGPIMEGAAEGFAVGFGQLIGSAAQGGNFLEGFFKLFIGTLADMAIQVGKTAIGIGIAVLGIKEALKSLNPAVAIAAGIALIALGTVAKSALSNIGDTGGATPFANGGIVSGPVNALVGEYAGAKNNPEVIAPLSKLKAMLNDTGGGTSVIEGEFVLRGTDLVRVIKRQGVLDKRTT